MSYPGSDPTVDSLHTAVNNLSTALDGAIDDIVTTITVLSTTDFPNVGAVTLEAERCSYTSKNATQFLGVTRGIGGTTAVSHVDTTPVKLTYGAEYHNDVRAEVIAVATDLRDCFKQDLNDTTPPAATGADMLVRCNHLATQLKNITGEADWKTVPPDTLDSLDTRLDTAETDIGDNTTDIGTNTTDIGDNTTDIGTNTSAIADNTTAVDALIQNAVNHVINGGLNVWERGNSFASPASGNFTADRWALSYDGAPTFTVDKETTIYDSGINSLKLDVTVVGGSTFMQLVQSVETANRFRDRTVTFAIRLKSSTSGLTLRINDSDGNASSSASTGSGSWELLTVTRTFSATVSVINIQIGFIALATAVSTIYLDSVMAVFGSKIMEYRAEDPQVELDRCLRHFEKRGDATNQVQLLSLGISDGTNYLLGLDQSFKVPKAATPTTTVTWDFIHEEGGVADQQGSYTKLNQEIDTDGFLVGAFKAIAGNKPNYLSFYWEAEV